MTRSINRFDKPQWSRIEAGYYVRPIGTHRTLEVVHHDHTPADKLHLDRWVVRVVEQRARTPLGLGTRTAVLGRFSTKRTAQTFADEWRAQQ